MFTKQEIKTHLLENYGFNNPMFGQKPNMNIVSKEPLEAFIIYKNGETLNIKSSNSKHWKIEYSNKSQNETFTTYATSLRTARDLLKDQIKAVALPKYDDFQKSMQEKVNQTKKFEHLYENVINKCKSYKSDKYHIFNAEISISTPYHKTIEDKKEIIEEVFKQYLNILNEYVPEQKLYYKEYFDNKLIFKIQTNKNGTNFPVEKLINLSRLLKPQLENIDINIRVTYWEIKNKQNREPFAKEFKKRDMRRCYYYGKYNPIIGFESTTHSNWLNRTLPIKDMKTFKKELNLPELINLEDISKRLEAKGFASTNIVFGIGSFSYQYHTRDTFGFAVKATSATVNGEERLLFKDPKTDDGTKRSQRGRVVVAKATDVSDLEVYQLTGQQTGNRLVWKDGLNESQEHELQQGVWNALEPVFLDGELLIDQDLTTIRERLAQNQ